MAGALSHINGNFVVKIPHRPSAYRPSSTHRPLIVMKQSYWASIDADVEAHLKQAITIRPPLTVFEPMVHLVFAAPRNTAPALCVAACELVGGHRDQALAAAAALHLMHAATCTHEHLPLTEGPMSKSKPAVQHAYGPDIELLTGDGIIPFGFELLARSDNPAQDNSDRILRVTIEIARVTGSQGIINGQYLEIQHGSKSDNRNKWIEDVCKKKEGELHACGAACGAILGGGSEEEIERLRKFGVYVGMIKGILNKVNNGEDKMLMKEVEELRSLALKELKGLNDRRIETISSLLDSTFCSV